MAFRSPLAPGLSQSLADRRQSHERQHARVLASLITIPGSAEPAPRSGEAPREAHAFQRALVRASLLISGRDDAAPTGQPA
jgi:hypothetical protein